MTYDAANRLHEIFGDDVIIVKGRGTNYDNSVNGALFNITTKRPNHAEPRGIQALISRGIDPRGARQATSLPSCDFCMQLRSDWDIINLTGGKR